MAFFDSSSTPVVDFLSSTPPSITRVLTYTSPFVHLFSYFLSLMTWSTGNPSESCLLVAAWWTLCLYPKELIIYGIHLSLLVWLVYNWIQKGKLERLGKPKNSKAMTQYDLNQTVFEIHTISEKLSDFHALINSLNSYIDWSDPEKTKRVIMILLYSYPIWIIFNYLGNLSWTFIILGTICLVWNSPWFKVIKYVVIKSTLLRETVYFIGGFFFRNGQFSQKRKGKGGFSVRELIMKAKGQQQQKLTSMLSNVNVATKKGLTRDGSKTSTDLIFQFVLYENQRWWLGLDWTTNLFPNERPPWSDEYLEPTDSKNNFQLPAPSTQTIDDKNVLIKTTRKWEWLDPDWTISHDGDVDKDGWVYTDNHWKNPTSKGGNMNETSKSKEENNKNMLKSNVVEDEKEKINHNNSDNNDDDDDNDEK
nr:6334_t:CDS:2 [Entrophospora candida]